MPTHHCQHAAHEAMEGNTNSQLTPVSLLRSVNWTVTFRAFTHIMTAHKLSCRICSEVYGRTSVCFLQQGTGLRAKVHCWTGLHCSFQPLEAPLLLQTHSKQLNSNTAAVQMNHICSWRCLSLCHSTNRRYIWAANTDSWRFVQYTWEVTLPGTCSVIWGLLNSSVRVTGL